MFMLWHGEILLGVVRPEQPPPPEGPWLGAFEPTEAFAPVWPLMRRLQEVEREIFSRPRVDLSEIPIAELPAFLRSDPTRAASVRAVQQILALRLELRDPTGRPLPDLLLLVRSTALDLRPLPPGSEPEYLLVAVPFPPGLLAL